VTPKHLVATLALGTAGLLTGCAGVQPGVAARVGDETIRVSDLNRITDGYCQAFERQLEGAGDVLTMEFLASNVLHLLVLAEAARQLAADYGVEPTAAYTDRVATQEQTAAVLAPEAAEASVVVDSSGAYIGDVMTSIGRLALVEDGVAEPSTDEALARGQDVLSVWLAENEPEVDPQYGLEVVDLQPTSVDTSTSFVVSPETDVAGRSYLFGLDQQQLTPEEQEQLAELVDYARGLPDSQRCG